MLRRELSNEVVPGSILLSEPRQWLMKQLQLSLRLRQQDAAGDNLKFVDCAIASNADFIVSHDKDFNVLKQVEFPKVLVVSTDQFEVALGEGN